MNNKDAKFYAACSERSYFSCDGESYTGDVQLREIKKKHPLRVLTEKDWQFWQKYGYVIVPNAIAKSQAQKTYEYLCEFQGIDPGNSETWFKADTFTTELDKQIYMLGLVETYHNQLLWDNRTKKRVYDAFVDVWDELSLWVTLDRANLNPPNSGNRHFDTFLHWDVDTSLKPFPIRVQGIIALNDTNESLGGFQCIPELFNNFNDWVQAAPPDRNPTIPNADPKKYPLVLPQMKQGDLLIFNALLAHGICKNISANGIRSIQYVSMMPALESHSSLKESRINSWKTNTTPAWDASFVGGAEANDSDVKPAELTELGKRLLGLKSWSAK